MLVQLTVHRARAIQARQDGFAPLSPSNRYDLVTRVDPGPYTTPPGVIAWGDRTFVLTGDKIGGEPVYVEAFAVRVPVEGYEAGQARLPGDTSPDPRSIEGGEG